MSNSNGRNWIQPRKRLAIYLRDGFACVYCGWYHGHGIEHGVPLTLDHLVPRSKMEQNNQADNLVTACKDCNDRKGDQDWQTYCRTVADETGQDWLAVVMHIRHCLNRPLPLAEARRLIEGRRWSQAIRAALGKEEIPC